MSEPRETKQAVTRAGLGPPLPLGEAQERAAALVLALEPVVLDCAIVGDVRREQPTVNQLELLVLPRPNPHLFEQEDADLEAISRVLAGQGRVERLTTDAWCCVLDTSTLTSGPREGRLFVFRARPTWHWAYRLFVHTGPLDFVSWCAQRLKRAGGRTDGLRAWLPDAGRRQVLAPVEDEAMLFTAIGLPFLTPAERTHWKATLRAAGAVTERELRFDL